MLHAGEICSYVKPVLNDQGLAFKQYVNYITALFVFDLLVRNYTYTGYLLRRRVNRPG